LKMGKIALKLCLSLVLLFSLSGMVLGNELNSGAIRLKFNGEPLKTIHPLWQERGVMMISLSDFCDSLGASFSYLPSSGRINVYHKNKTLNLQVGQDKLLGLKETIKIGGKPLVREGAVYLPLRGLAHLLGEDVAWSAAKQEVDITTPVSKWAFVFNSQSVKGKAGEAAQQFIPLKAELITSLRENDLDGDGVQEVVVGYKTKQNRVGIIVLKKEEDSFRKVWQKEDRYAYGLNDLLLADINNDGKDEIILGWLYGVSAGAALEIITWQNGQFDSIYANGYHRLEVGDFNQDGKLEMALWQKDTGEYYQINTYNWDGDRFVVANQSYSSYFTKAVDYYQQLAKNDGQSRLLDYYLADAYQKAANNLEALKFAQRGLAIEGSSPTDAIFWLLEGKVAYGMQRYQESIANYQKALVAFSLAASVLPEAHWGLAQNFLALGNQEKALKEIKEAINLGNGWEGYQKAKEILLNQPKH